MSKFGVCAIAFIFVISVIIAIVTYDKITNTVSPFAFIMLIVATFCIPFIFESGAND